MNSSDSEARVALVRQLIAGDRDPSEVTKQLATSDWDWDGPEITLSTSEIGSVLRRFVEGAIDAAWVERWASAVEVRDDIAFEPANEDLIKDILFELATPELEGPLTSVRAAALIAQLA